MEPKNGIKKGHTKVREKMYHKHQGWTLKIYNIDWLHWGEKSVMEEHDSLLMLRMKVEEYDILCLMLGNKGNEKEKDDCLISNAYQWR